MSQNAPRGTKKGSILVAKRKKKFRKPSAAKATVQRGSALIRGYQAELYTDCEAALLKADPGLTSIKVPAFQQLGVKILMGGHPKAFIEFFELTHQPQPPAPSPDYVDPKDIAGAKRLIDFDTLAPLKVAMENAEMGVREGNYEKIFFANYAIGDIFEEVKDPKQALFYFWRAFRATEKTKNTKQIAMGRFALGRVYWKLKNSQHAIQNYEHFITMAKTNKNIAGMIEATENLLEIHIKCAEQFKEDEDFQSSLECYEKALKSALLAQNWVAAGEMRYQLGLLNSKLKRADKALEYLTEFHQYCVKVKDIIGQGKANEAMSEVFEALDQVSDAVAHMENYLNVVDGASLLTKAQAACKIGMLYHRLSDLVAADLYFTRYYEMARQSKDVKTIAIARVNLGIVRAALDRSPAVLKEEDQPVYSKTPSPSSSGSDSDDSW
ncbi:hypothetical protein KC19_6G207300 [Ceratodon purpureus]|uniref:Tetratricopeptide repeat protein 29 n=1 Tax=Ceratodon purpureus TaxID=3225 RepID=A0A8T0HJR4_CERPU|nr:hypothetical protein KC19_6G207300 [Ceratodon purpureus]KAG0571042.1 hypothetical protein KC19_6G207300 [Ceratodon purpureus]